MKDTNFWGLPPKRPLRNVCTTCGDHYQWQSIDGVLFTECPECRREVKRERSDRMSYQPDLLNRKEK
jgi:hypothetical protein